MTSLKTSGSNQQNTTRMAATATRKQLSDLVECPICTEVYTEPRTLPCLHTFCLVCCEGFCRNKQPGNAVSCPLCREQFTIPPDGVRGLRKNFILEKLKLISRPSSAADPLAKKIRNSLRRSCDKHVNKDLELYCLDCNEAVCATCIVTSHNSHRISEAKEFTDDRRVKLTSVVAGLEKLYRKCELDVAEFQNAEKEFTKHVQTVESEINHAAKRLQQIIERHRVELLADLSVKVRDRLNVVESMKQEVQQKMAVVNSLMRYTAELATNGAADDVARECDVLNEQAKDLLQFDDDVESVNSKLGSFSLAFKSRSDETPALADTSSVNLVGSLSSIKIKFVKSLNEDMLVGGLTVFGNELFVSYCSLPDIAVYDTEMYNIQRRLSVPGLGDVSDMASCARHRCLYIADSKKKIVHRVDFNSTDAGVQNNCTNWTVDDKPYGLSVNANHHLIVTCLRARKIKLFTSDGHPIRVIDLQRTDHVGHPMHTVQLTSEKFVVCHGTKLDGTNDPAHGVCVVDGNGAVRQSFGGRCGPGPNQLNAPQRLVVAVSGCIIVIDQNNRRVQLLSPSLSVTRTVVSGLSGYPCKVSFDEQSGRLFLAERKYDFDRRQWTVGNVSVYSVGS